MSAAAATKKEILTCCREGQLARLQQLLNQGVDIQTVDNTEFAPLNMALKYGRWQVAKFLLQQAALPNYSVTPPLIAACQYRKDDITGLDMVYRHTANLNITDAQDRTGLMTVCLLGHEKKFIFLLKHCDDVDKQDQQGMSALLDAVTSQSIELIKKLIKAGANVNLCNHNNENAALLALQTKQPVIKLIQLLIKHQVSITHRSKQGLCAYDLARDKYPAIVKLMDTHTAKEQQIELPLFQTDQPKPKSTADSVDENNRDFTQTQKNSKNKGIAPNKIKSAWFIAVSEGNLGQLNKLLIKGQDINHCDDKGCTALIHAAGQGRRAVASFLIQKGANIEHHSANGSTALSSAIISQSKNIVELLLRFPINVDATGPGSYPYISLAAAQWSDSCLSRLIEAGADPFRKDPNGGNLYHNVLAAAAYYSQTTKALQTLRFIETQKLNINHPDCNGRTPLILLCRLVKSEQDHQAASLAHQLLKWNADTHHKDKNGRTALDYCEINQLSNTRGVIMSFNH